MRGAKSTLISVWKDVPNSFEAEQRQKGATALKLGVSHSLEACDSPSSSCSSSVLETGVGGVFVSFESVMLQFRLFRGLPQVKHPSVKFHMVMLVKL